MKMNRLERKYLIDENGSDDFLFYAVDCYEKILYHAIKDYGVDHKFAFCDDINLCFTHDVNKGKVHFDLNESHVNDSLFLVNRYLPDHDSIEKILKEKVDSGKITAVRTMFDMLAPYVWYKNEDRAGISNTHFCLVVGYDDESYYFVDDRWMVNSDRWKPYSKNPTIGIIERHHFLEALNVFCEIMVVEINTELLNEVNKFDEVAKKIVESYYVKYAPKPEYEYPWYVGREALEKIAELTYTKEKFQPIKRHLEKNLFFVHLLIKRREILKQCLQVVSDQYDSHKVTKLINAIDDSIKEWRVLQSISSKQSLKSYDNFELIIREHFEKLVQTEDSLIGCIDELIITE